MKNLFKQHEIQFIAWFAGIFLVSIALLSSIGFIPSEFEDAPTGDEPSFVEKARLAILGVDYWSAPSITSNGSESNPNQATQSGQQMTVNGQGTKQMINAETAIRIAIPVINVDSIIRNPASTDTDLLDSELKRGAVHYPGSGAPGSGNMFIFGHSTSFKIVNNQAYKVFNDIKDLQNGDDIKVYSNQHVYTYRVSSVKKVDKNDTWVKFDIDKDTLTLSTCDSFGKKADRYVVQADYISIGDVK